MGKVVTPRIRDYRGVADLRLMQDLVVHDFAHTAWRIGDLAWAVRENTHLELSLYVRLFFADSLLGWTWTWGRGLIEVHLAPAERDVALYDLMLATGEDIAKGLVHAGDPKTGCRTWVDERDSAMVVALGKRGFAPAATALQINRRELDAVPEVPALPAGWSTAAVDTDERTSSRVECHRAAFAPSTLTVEKYRRAQRCWPYRAELDRVILDETGAVVAACTTWLDEANGEGLLEPVSTRPADQRRGFGRAVCIDALRALRSAGARSAQVGCVAESAACDTYRSIGFEPCGRLAGYAKAL